MTNATKQLITELTPEQEAKLVEYRNEGLRLGLEEHPNGLPNPEEIVGLVNRLYAAYKIDSPTVYFEASPKAGRIKVDAILGQETKFKWDFMAGSQELYWLYFYKFINNELPVEKTTLPLIETCDLMERVGWIFLYETFVVVTPKPAKICMVNNRLHNANGPALEWVDGYKLYALNGVRFSGEMSKFISTPIAELDYKAVLNIKNVEQRAEVIKRVGIDKLFTYLAPTLIDSGRGYQLYEIKVYEDSPRIYLKMDNPSVPEVHIEAVHPDCKTVDQALNWRNLGTVELPKTGFIAPLILT